jgi:hypothetical protein
MRAITWVACIVSLSGCRLGFDELSGSGAGGDDVITTPPVPGVAHVTVIGEDGEVRAGQPIADAYVVAIEQDGSTSVVRTADDGTADIDIFGNTAIHVARPMGSNNEWALSSFRGLNDGARLIVGGQPPPAMSVSRSLSVTLPTYPMGYSEAWITGPRKCMVDTAYAASSTIPLTYDPQCEGQTVELYAFSYNLYVPLGTVTFANGATINRTTSTWMDLDKVHMEYFNLPADVTSAGVYLSFPASGGDLIPIGDNGNTPDSEHYVGIVIDIPPVKPESLLVHAFQSATGVRFVYERIDSWPGNRMFDGSTLAPAPPSPMINAGTSQVQWTAGSAPDADAYWSSTDLTIGGTLVHWNAFGPSASTQVTFPVLPPELALIVPTATSTWSPPRIVLAGLSDFDYASVVEIIDRDIFWWWSEGLHMPTGTLSLTSTAIP